jgi:RND family efflux transporter MFP subunit
MKYRFNKNSVITIFAVLCAIGICFVLWRYYEVYPHTPDGRVLADIVQVTPDVSGLVTEIYVTDNQIVKAGDPLFQIDLQRYRLDKEQACANLEGKESMLEQARRDANRNHSLGTLVADETKEQSRSRVEELSSAVAQSKTGFAIAQLNLERATVRASVNGKVTNFSLKPGYYAVAGHPAFALVDMNSFHVDGYFEETKLHSIHLGDRADIEIMGERSIIKGHVQGIAGGIEDRDRTMGNNLLANVNPSFSWVRLAQRVPVRIALDEVPGDILLVIGRTASIEIRKPSVNTKHGAR